MWGNKGVVLNDIKVTEAAAEVAGVRGAHLWESSLQAKNFMSLNVLFTSFHSFSVSLKRGENNFGLFLRDSEAIILKLQHV